MDWAWMIGAVWLADLRMQPAAATAETAPPLSPARTELVSLDGLAIPSRQAELAFAVSGVLQSIDVEVGQRVEAGAPLASLNADIERCAMERARIASESTDALRAAEVEVNMRKEEVERQRDLARRNVASGWELRQAELALELATARAAEERTKRDLRIEDYRLAQAAHEQRRILAPGPGVVARTLRRPGEAVDLLKPVIVLVQLDPLWVELDVPSRFAGLLTRGQTARVTFESGTVEAAVCEVEPLVDAGSMTFRVRLSVPNPQGRLTAGVSVAAQLRVPERAAASAAVGTVAAPSAAAGVLK